MKNDISLMRNFEDYTTISHDLKLIIKKLNKFGKIYNYWQYYKLNRL